MNNHAHDNHQSWKDREASLAADQLRRENTYAWLGRAWARKARSQARTGSVYQAARNLRKQGVGLQTALILLTR